MKRRFRGPFTAVLLVAVISACASSQAEIPGVSPTRSPAVPVPDVRSVPGIEEVQLSVEPTSIRVGDTARVVARALGADGQELAGVEFRIRTPGRILGVIDGGAAVVAVREGSAIVTAEAQIEAVPVPGVARGSIQMTVLPAPLARIEITVSAQMYEGTRATASAAATTAYGPRETSPLITWRSTDVSVLRVSPNGRLQATEVGIAQLEARSEGVSTSREINVVRNPVRRLSVAPRESDLRAGDVVHLSATAVDAEG
ncbi:MAG: hypothetical protein E4H28_03715, partial [Gemmatimonadales bacterium]